MEIKEALNKSILDFSEHGRQEAWFLPTLREQWLTPLFTAAHPCAAGSSELVQSFPKQMLFAMATALVATCSTPAFAAVVYDAIGPGNAYVQYQIGWQVNASFAPTVEFAASGNYEVTQIDVLLVYDSGTNGATISLLTATTGGAPGDVLGSWGVSALPASGLGPLTTVYSISQVNLLAGQSYFLRIAPADATTNGAWLFGANETTIYNGDALAYSSNNAPAFRILGSSPVPLPAAAWLLGSAIGGLGFLRRCSQPGSAVRTGSRRGAVFLHGRRRNWATLRADELGDRNMFTVANGR